MEEKYGDCEIITHPQNKNLGAICELEVDTITNIVAFGTLLEDEFVNTTIQGVLLEEESVRLSVDGVIKDDALLLFHAKDKMETVDEVVGSHVAWPKELVILGGMSKIIKFGKRKRMWFLGDHCSSQASFIPLCPNVANYYTNMPKRS